MFRGPFEVLLSINIIRRHLFIGITLWIGLCYVTTSQHDVLQIFGFNLPVIVTKITNIISASKKKQKKKLKALPFIQTLAKINIAR